MNYFNQDYMLSGYDIFSIIGYEVGICLESDIDSTNFVLKTMEPDHSGNRVLLILLNDQDPVYRHWACIIRNSAGRVCYFDSMGDAPTNEYLLPIVDSYMPIQLQQAETMTCGRWVGHFVRFYEGCELEYASMFEADADEYITMTTGDIAKFNMESLDFPNALWGLE